MTYKINVVIEKDVFEYFAYVPDLKGCHTQGKSLDDVIASGRFPSQRHRICSCRDNTSVQSE